MNQDNTIAITAQSTDVPLEKECVDYKRSLKKKGSSIIERFIRVERYINRPLAYLVVKAVYKTPITPNGLTYFSFLLGLASATAFALGTPGYFILGGILIQLSSIIDCADGQLARAKNMCSDYGSHLDLFLDRITDFTVVVGIAYGLYRHNDDKIILMLGLAAVGTYLLAINLFYLTKNYLADESRGETGEARALLLFGFFVMSLFNRLDLTIYILFIESVANIVLRLIYFISLSKKQQS